MERNEAASIIEQRVKIDRSLIGGVEPVSDFDKFIAEQDVAMDVAIQMLRDPVSMLTREELRRAYEIQQHYYDVQDILDELDSNSEYYAEKYGIDQKPVTESELEDMAYVLRGKLDDDADACWSVCKDEAISEILRKRLKHTRYIIGRPINGISINGLEYVLDDTGRELEFDSIDDAKAFLHDIGISDQYIESQGIEFQEVQE